MNVGGDISQIRCFFRGGSTTVGVAHERGRYAVSIVGEKSNARQFMGKGILGRPRIRNLPALSKAEAIGKIISSLSTSENVWVDCRDSK